MRADCRKAPRPPAIERRAAPDCRKAEASPWRRLWARADRDAPWPSPWLWVRGRAGPPWPLLLPLRSIAEPGTGGPPSESPWTAESGSRSEGSGGGWEWRPGRRPPQSGWAGGRRRPSGRRRGGEVAVAAGTETPAVGVARRATTTFGPQDRAGRRRAAAARARVFFDAHVIRRRISSVPVPGEPEISAQRVIP